MTKEMMLRMYPYGQLTSPRHDRQAHKLTAEHIFLPKHAIIRKKNVSLHSVIGKDPMET